MSVRPPSTYFHASPPQSGGHEASRSTSMGRDNSGCTQQSSTSYWGIPQRSSTDPLPAHEMERLYAPPSPLPYMGTDNGSRMHYHEVHVGARHISSSSVIQPPPELPEMQSASIHHNVHTTSATASVSFPDRGGPSHAPQPWDSLDAAYVRPYEGPSCMESNTARRINMDPYVDGSSRGVVNIDPLDTEPAHQTWDGMIGTAYAPQAPLYTVPVHPWPSSVPARIQPFCPTFNDTDASSVEPSAPAIDEDVDDTENNVCCEWTDEHGTCNMDVVGDRVWMSHHLSREHNVVGHEKALKACHWRGCTDTMNKGSLARHVVSRHLRAGAICEFCSKVYSRADVARRHIKKCKVANGATGQPQRDDEVKR